MLARLGVKPFQTHQHCVIDKVEPETVKFQGNKWSEPVAKYLIIKEEETSNGTEGLPHMRWLRSRKSLSLAPGHWSGDQLSTPRPVGKSCHALSAHNSSHIWSTFTPGLQTPGDTSCDGAFSKVIQLFIAWTSYDVVWDIGLVTTFLEGYIYNAVQTLGDASCDSAFPRSASTYHKME